MRRWSPAPRRDEEEEEEGRRRKIPTKIRRCRAHTSPMAPFCAGPHTTSTVGCFRGRDGSGKACEGRPGRCATAEPRGDGTQRRGRGRDGGDQGLRGGWTRGGDVLLGEQHRARWGGDDARGGMGTAPMARWGT